MKEKFKVQLEKTFSNMSKAEQNNIKQTCLTLAKSEGLLALFNLTRNDVIHRAIYERQFVNDYVMGRIDQIDELYDFVVGIANFEVEENVSPKTS